MAKIETWFGQDLKEAVKVRYMDGNVFSADNAGNIIGVNVFNGGSPASLSGSVSANIIRADGVTVAAAGTLSGNKASVVLPQAAYAVPGAISIVIKLTSGTDITTLCAVVGNVYMSSTDSVVDPGTIIPSIETLIAEIEAAIASIPADYSDLWKSIAPAFSTSTAYAKGQYVTYDGHFWRFTSDHPAGTWNSDHAQQTAVGTELRKSFKREGNITSSNKQAICGGDCNGIQVNTFYSVDGDANLSHEPFDESFYTIATFGKYAERSAGDFQIATRATDGLTKIRTYYNDDNGWNGWAEIPNGVLTFTAANTTISDSNKQSICGGDCNGIPNNMCYGVEGTTTLTHEPFSNAFYTIITFGKYSKANRSAGDFQIATQASDGTTKIRTYHNTNGWSGWKEIPNGVLTFTAANTTISNSNKQSICGGDCNSIPNNMCYGVNGDTTLSHEPFSNSFYTIITFGKYSKANRSAGDFQIATHASDGITKIRTYKSNEDGWNAWIEIPNGVLTFTAANTTISNSNKQSICNSDCNGIPNNTCYGVNGDTTLSHEPFSNSFYTIITFGKYSKANRSAGDFQIATQASDGTTKIRTYHSNEDGWNGWTEIPNGVLTFTAANTTISNSNKQSICGGDCNGIPNNMCYGVEGTTVLDHAPISGSFYNIITFGKYSKTNRSAGDLQIASDTYNGGLYYRDYINSTNGWTPWKKVQETVTDESVYSGVGMFEKFGVIGDSFASGPILPGTADPLNQNFNLSWGQILARKAGVTCVNYSEGGCGTYRFLDTTNRDYNTHLMGKLLSDISGGNKCGLYLLCMGINDSASWREFGNKHGGLEYLGSSADINTSDYTQNANSFWGNYGKIIQRLKQLTPNSRLVMCTYCRKNDSDLYAYNEYIQAIQEIAAFFSIPCITLTDDHFFNSKFYINNLVDNHPTAPQYVGYAAAIDRLLSRAIVNNYNYFKVYKQLP